jgi:Mn-dependent DtxR family transcriptional regulator
MNVTLNTLARMLGVRRESVTTAGRLQDLGVIKYARGEITVLKRQQLKKLSCECYATLKKETDRLQSPHSFE